MSDAQIEGKTPREWVLWLVHIVRGNGGKGLLSRMDEAEKENDFVRANFIDKTECQKNRVADYSNLESKLDHLQEQIERLYNYRVSDKRMTITMIGILVSASMSAISLFVRFL